MSNYYLEDIHKYVKSKVLLSLVVALYSVIIAIIAITCYILDTLLLLLLLPPSRHSAIIAIIAITCYTSTILDTLLLLLLNTNPHPNHPPILPSP